MPKNGGRNMETKQANESENKKNETSINLSAMVVGDRAVYDNQVVELRDQGRQGGTEFDLWLAYVGESCEFNTDYPPLVVDRDDVSI
jgi:trehalose-6-phosphatase